MHENGGRTGNGGPFNLVDDPAHPAAHSPPALSHLQGSPEAEVFWRGGFPRGGLPSASCPTLSPVKARVDSPPKLFHSHPSQASARIGGKGTVRRKPKATQKASGTDDKKLQAALKRVGVQAIPGIEEVRMRALCTGWCGTQLTRPSVLRRST